MTTYILKENALTDNLIMFPDNNKIFKGNYIAIIWEFYFLNSWNDRKEIKRFRSQKKLETYLLKYYPDFIY